MFNRSQVWFLVLMPVVCAVVAVLSVGLLALLFSGMLFLAFPIFGAPIVFVALGCAACVAAFAWLWHSLWTGLTRVPPHHLAIARVLALAGCVPSIGYFEFFRQRAGEPGQSTLALLLGVIGVEALFAYVAVGLLLVFLRWRPMPEAAEIGRGRALALVLVAWIGFVSLAIVATGSMEKAMRVAQSEAWSAKGDREQAQAVNASIIEPVARALCMGNLNQAAAALARPDANPDVEGILLLCLTNSRGYDTVAYPERYPLALEAVLAAERRKGLDSAVGCTQWQQKLLVPTYRYGPQHLALFASKGLPVDCLDEQATGSRAPLWWKILPSIGGMSLENLQLMDRAGLDWQRRDDHQQTLFQERHNVRWWSQLSNDALLFLVERTLPKEGELTTWAVSQVLRCRFRRSWSAQQQASVNALIARSGELSRRQVAEGHYVGSWSDVLIDPLVDEREMVTYLWSRLDPDRVMSPAGPAGLDKDRRALFDRLR
jgi:hypothetical protein